MTVVGFLRALTLATAAASLGVLVLMVFRTFSLRPSRISLRPPGLRGRGLVYAFGRGMLDKESVSLASADQGRRGGSTTWPYSPGSLMSSPTASSSGSPSPVGVPAAASCRSRRGLEPVRQEDRQTPLGGGSAVPMTSSPTSFVDSFLLLALLHSFIPALEPVLLGFPVLLFVYIPLGKIRHRFFFFYTRIVFGLHFGRRGALPGSGQARLHRGEPDLGKRDPYEEKLDNLTDADIARILAELRRRLKAPEIAAAHTPHQARAVRRRLPLLPDQRRARGRAGPQAEPDPGGRSSTGFDAGRPPGRGWVGGKKARQGARPGMGRRSFRPLLRLRAMHGQLHFRHQEPRPSSGPPAAHWPRPELVPPELQSTVAMAVERGETTWHPPRRVAGNPRLDRRGAPGRNRRPRGAHPRRREGCPPALHRQPLMRTQVLPPLAPSPRPSCSTRRARAGPFPPTIMTSRTTGSTRATTRTPDSCPKGWPRPGRTSGPRSSRPGRVRARLRLDPLGSAAVAEQALPVPWSGSILEVAAGYLRAGRIRLDPPKNKKPLTLHDPCNLDRLGGVVEEQRHSR
ncbi:MAG: hypothetical protein M0C28_04620 [Candidatus Moduliflexus flocculans]|nr:hypothetical protein [Candidatus Moduliflexus flocculans]